MHVGMELENNGKSKTSGNLTSTGKYIDDPANPAHLCTKNMQDKAKYSFSKTIYNSTPNDDFFLEEGQLVMLETPSAAETGN